MKHAVLCLFSMLVGIAVGIATYGSYQAHNFHYETAEPEIQYVYIEKEPEIITETVYVEVEAEPEFYRTYTDSDAWYFWDGGMREVEGEGVIGFLWFFKTFENRMKVFGTTPEEEWASSAYESSMFRTGIEPNEDCMKAWELFVEGWNPEPLYFRAGHYHSFGTELCQVGNHYFSY